MRPNVLVTSASAKAPLIRTVQLALYAGRVYAADCDYEAPARYVADGFWQSPDLRSIKIEDVIDFCDEHDVGLIIPTRNYELLRWARWSEQLLTKDIHCMVSPAETIVTCIDKERFNQVLGATGEPVIPLLSWMDVETAATKMRYVVKERFGTGSSRLGLDLDAVAATAVARTLSSAIVQPFIKGTEYSIDLYVDRRGGVRGIIPRRRVRIVHGEAQITETVRDEMLEELAARVATVLGIRGVAVIQVIVDEHGQPHIVECNPRFGGASTLSVAAGLRVFEWALREARDLSLDDSSFERVEGELRQVRLTSDLTLPLERN